MFCDFFVQEHEYNRKLEFENAVIDYYKWQFENYTREHMLLLTDMQ